jgi:molybdopterin-guanine dinucleotide biosynthesis protein A
LGVIKEIKDLTCIVLAGGKSLRLGRDKAFEIIGDDSLIERVTHRLAFFSSQIIVVAAEKRLIPLLSHLTAKVVVDLYPGKGSLGGVYTGLTVSDSLHNLVVACDMPFLSSALLDHIIQLSPGFDLVIPRVGGMLEPLHAVYSKNCLTPMEQLLQQDRLRIGKLSDLVKVRYVENDEIDRFDPEHLSFLNINTETDLERARELARKEQTSRREH